MAKKPKENKQLIELGNKSRAGQLLSTYLRAIADERTEVVDIAVSPDKVEHKVISKAEAIARDMFRIAMGNSGSTAISGVEVILDSKLVLEYRKLILDRIDGKAGTTDDSNKERDKIPDRISEINKARANRIAEESMAGAEDED